VANCRKWLSKALKIVVLTHRWLLLQYKTKSRGRFMRMAQPGSFQHFPIWSWCPTQWRESLWVIQTVAISCHLGFEFRDKPISFSIYVATRSMYVFGNIPDIVTEISIRPMKARVVGSFVNDIAIAKSMLIYLSFIIYDSRKNTSIIKETRAAIYSTRFNCLCLLSW
jgi:hypothetical protein